MSDISNTNRILYLIITVDSIYYFSCERSRHNILLGKEKSLLVYNWFGMDIDLDIKIMYDESFRFPNKVFQ